MCAPVTSPFRRRFAQEAAAARPAVAAAASARGEGSGALREEASDRMRALEEAAGDAPKAAVTGSIGDFLPRSLRGALRRHDLIRRLEREQARLRRPPPDSAATAEAEEEARLRAYRHVDSRTIFDDRPDGGAAPSGGAGAAPTQSAYDLEQSRLIRGLEAAAGPAVAQAVLGQAVIGRGKADDLQL